MEELNKIKTYIANTKTSVEVPTADYVEKRVNEILEGTSDIDGGTPSSNFSFLLNNLDCGTTAAFTEIYTPIECGGV